MSNPVVQQAFVADTGAAGASLTSAPGTETFASTSTSTIVPPAGGKFYTEEDLTKARQQEKDKLYTRLETMSETVARLEKEREERAAAEADARRAAEDEALKKSESEMDLRSLLEKKEKEWQEQLRAEQEARERYQAELDMERQYQSLLDYRQNALVAEQDNIIPELLDLVSGNTPEEIDASINSLKDRSARILEAAQAATQNSRREMVGARVTAPSVGPLDTNTGNQQLTPEQIRGMSMNEYVQHRSRLIGKSPTSRGLFG